MRRCRPPARRSRQRAAAVHRRRDRRSPIRRAVSVRWLTGTILTGFTSIFLMGGALMAALNNPNQFAASPKPPSAPSAATATPASASATRATACGRSRRRCQPADPPGHHRHQARASATSSSSGPSPRSSPRCRRRRRDRRPGSRHTTRSASSPTHSARPAGQAPTARAQPRRPDLRRRCRRRGLGQGQPISRPAIRHRHRASASTTADVERSCALRPNIDAATTDMVAALPYIDPTARRRALGDRRAARTLLGARRQDHSRERLQHRQERRRRRRRGDGRRSSPSPRARVSARSSRRTTSPTTTPTRSSPRCRRTGRPQPPPCRAEGADRVHRRCGRCRRPQVVPIRRIDLRDGAHQATVARADDNGFVRADEPSLDAGPSPTAAGEPAETGAHAAGSTTRVYETALEQQVPAAADRLSSSASSPIDVDFQARISPGDSLEVFHSHARPGRPRGGRRRKSCTPSLTLGGVTKRFYRFRTPDDGVVDYYDEEGKSAKKFLMRKPMTVGILRSGFGWRVHPILGYRRLHTGVDYAAPRGTPILAAGNGVVEKVGPNSGYGNFILIHHTNGYETGYGHQPGFAKGIVPGARVRQGQIIGYVGSTGLRPARISISRSASTASPSIRCASACRAAASSRAKCSATSKGARAHRRAPRQPGAGRRKWRARQQLPLRRKISERGLSRPRRLPHQEAGALSKSRSVPRRAANRAREAGKAGASPTVQNDVGNIGNLKTTATPPPKPPPSSFPPCSLRLRRLIVAALIRGRNRSLSVPPGHPSPWSRRGSRRRGSGRRAGPAPRAGSPACSGRAP